MPDRVEMREETKHPPPGEDGYRFEKEAQPFFSFSVSLPLSLQPSMFAFPSRPPPPFPPPSCQACQPPGQRPQGLATPSERGTGSIKTRRACPCSEKLRNLDCEMG